MGQLWLSTSICTLRRGAAEGTQMDRSHGRVIVEAVSCGHGKAQDWLL